jgi:secondary thiamine-phosphate synthase enzyme
MIEFKVKTSSRNQMIDITSEVTDKIPSGFTGITLVYVPHTTAGITINEGADPSVRADILEHLEELVPAHAGYKHQEGNSDSHIKSSIIGSSINLIIENGKPVLGTWQAVYFCEFDGPRQRKVFLSLSEKA